jgi:hypothetical protein
MNGRAFEDQTGRSIRSVAAFKSIDPPLEPMTERATPLLLTFVSPGDRI